jgi:hypothetical protein
MARSLHGICRHFEQIASHFFTEPGRIAFVRRPQNAPFRPPKTPGITGKQRPESEISAISVGKSRQRDLAPSPDGPLDAAFGSHPEPGRSIVHASKKPLKCRIVGPAFNRQCPLANCRQTELDRQELGHPLEPPEPCQTGGSKQYGVYHTLVASPDPGVDVATQGDKTKIPARAGKLHLAPQRRGADARSKWQLLDGPSLATDGNVARIFTLRDRGNRQPIRQVCWHVLHRVDGKISPTLDQGKLDLFDE